MTATPAPRGVYASAGAITPADADKPVAAAAVAAVLFDLDGLLVDSEPVWYAVEAAAVHRLGGTWGREHQANCIGGTLDHTCRYMASIIEAPVDVDALRDEIVAEMVARFATVLPVHAGALDLVDAVRARGVATGLVSSSYRLLVDAALHRLGADRFDVTVAGDEVRRGKPDPEPYATACARLGLGPGRCVVLEDALTGVRSAEAAGCRVVAVPSVAPIDPAPGRRVVGALADVDVDWLLASGW